MANPRACELFGYKEGELIGYPVESLIPMSKRDGHKKLRGDFQKQPQKRSMGAGMNLSALRKDGTTFYVEISLNHVNIDGEKYISINILDFSARVVYENIPDEIIDVLECSIDGNILYAIGKDKSLLKLKGSKNRIKLLKKYKLNNSAHTVSDYLDLIFISGDEGLSVFVKSIEKTHQKLIIDEFNKNAVFKSENQISFGSIHGVYKINDVNELIKSSYLTNLDNYNQSEYNYENLIVLFVVLLFLFSTRIFKTKKLSNEELVVEIKKYINKNLKTVTLNSLEDKFNIDYNAINNLQNEFRPAKYIKNKRNEIAKEMFLNGEKVSKISKQTGYSESYLIKNKYSFTRK